MSLEKLKNTMAESEKKKEDESPPPLTPAESAAATWFGYIGFGIVIVSLAIPFIIFGLAIYWFFYGRT